MPDQSKESARKVIRGREWKRPYNISLDKYSTISKAILAVLTPDPVRYGELVSRVKKKIRNFPGSIEWYTIASLRELESAGKVIRTKGKPTTYRKA